MCVGFRREKQTFSSAISMKTTKQACQLVVSCQLGGFPSYLFTHNLPSPVISCKYNQRKLSDVVKNISFQNLLESSLCLSPWAAE